ncbi:hypothetical protein N7493_004016 [Penicillium malachiteum]|uniref:GPI anchored protein n=1 Tax=Penicillium malachiteum TaxID=1324776 RepID=A0AAD6HQP7_9EURO|nr:hypothetical protein N7493_004016 [Penicillium malachiteum]
MTPILNKLGLALLFLQVPATLAASPAPQNQPRLRSNATLNIAKSSKLDSRRYSGLTERYFYWECPSGYDECSTDTSVCCPTGNGCCESGYCSDPGDTCCTIGTCPSGWNCCGNDGYCSPEDGECCEGGYYCNAGYQCKTWGGEDLCCPDSGCIGSSDDGDLGSTVDVGTGAAESTSSYSYTYDTYTYDTYTYDTYTYASYDYYYTTYYWSYWFYFWTSYSPYTVQTVTSTETTTTTVWSAYATDSYDADESFTLSIELYTFYTPYSATSLKSSTDPVPIATGAAGTPTATGIAHSGVGAATSVHVNKWVPIGCALFGGLMGVLAFGL